MMQLRLPFKEVWVVDFEFLSPEGGIPDPVCMVARETNTGREILLWRDDLKVCAAPPYSIGSDSVFVAYYASAEMGCHLALNWPLPTHVLDLYAEFRSLTNGKPLISGKGLVGACLYFGLDSADSARKDEMRQLVLRGSPWSIEETNAILEYCKSDVYATAKLCSKVESRIDLPRALHRGSYMKAVARMEYAGVPTDVEAMNTLKTHWLEIQNALIQSVDRDYGVYEGRTFKVARFETFLAKHHIPWPRLASGRLDLRDGTFREMARVHPAIAPLHELRATISKMRLSDLAVGGDGRNRTLLSPFSSKTGRNQPSTTRFIFGPATWIRGLIRPEPGRGLAYIDWAQQEFGIAAALSGDDCMMEAYGSGDPYLTFAKQAGAVPRHATKETHGREREIFKACALAVQYGMGTIGLAQRIGCSVFEARELLRLHHRTYQRFWKWSDAAVDYVSLKGKLWTTFGWWIHYDGDINPRSVRNFPMQANGAEMMRIACILASERGVSITAPVHDALLIEFELDREEETIMIVERAMKESSRLVLGEFELRTETQVIRYPQRYMDQRGEKMWKTVWDIVWKLYGPSHVSGALTGTCQAP